MYTAKQNDGSNKKDFLVFDTLSELRDAKNLRIGAQVQLNGYNTVGDFGDPLKGTYGLTGGFSADIDDGNFGTDVGTGGDLSYPVDGGYFNYSPNPSSKINAKWFGAKGDGFNPHDQSGSTVTDDRAALQAALNYINSEYALSRELLLPRGSYNIKSNITVSGNDVGLCFSWRNSFNNDPTAANPAGTNDTKQGVRIYGEGFRMNNAGVNQGGTLIVYLGATQIDGVCYVDDGTDGYTGFENLAIHGNKWGTLGLNRFNATMADDNLNGTGIILEDETKADRCYYHGSSGARAPYRLYKDIELAGALVTNGEFGLGFKLDFFRVEAKQCWGDGIKVDATTSLYMERCLVSYYVKRAYNLSGNLYYSQLNNCIFEQWLYPDNPDFDPLGAAPPVADSTYSPYYHLPTFYWEEWTADDSYGTGFYVNSEQAKITFNACGAEGSRRILYSEDDGCSFEFNNCQLGINLGTRSFFTTKGQLTAGVAAPAKGAGVTFDVDFDPTAELADGDFIFVGRRTANQYTGWPAKYSAEDNFVNWNAGDTVYGHWLIVTGRTTGPNQITATRLTGAGSFWTFNNDAADWPSGTQSWVTGDYVALIGREDIGIMKLATPGTGDEVFNATSISFNDGSKLGLLGDSNITANPKMTTKLLEGFSAFDQIWFDFQKYTKALGTDENVVYYEEPIQNIAASEFSSATVYAPLTRNILASYDTTTEVNQKLNVSRTKANTGAILDGVNGYGELDDPTAFSLTANGSMTIIFNTNADISAVGLRGIFSTTTSAAGNAALGGINIYSKNNDAGLRVTLRQQNAVAGHYEIDFDDILDGTWKNIAVVIDYSGADPDISMIVNGVDKGAGTVVTTKTGVYDDSATPLRHVFFGVQDNAPTRPIGGSFNSLYVYDSALTPANILSYYQDANWYQDGTGIISAQDMNEGVGYQGRDRTANNRDLLWTPMGVTWVDPKTSGLVRDFTLDANGAAAYVLSSSRDILPPDAIVTRVLVKNNDAGNITSGNFDVNRYDGTNRATIGDNGAQIDAGDSFVIYPNATQDTADRRIEIPDNSDAGMDDFDIIVQYEIIG